jgi:hypothetical protein
MRPLKILTWHTHGSYLYYLTQAPHQFYVLSKPGRPAGYGGRCGHIPWGDNVIDLPVDQAAGMQFDCILFQDDDQYLKDQYEFLTPAQRQLPRIYIEHDTPREHPTDMRHPVDDPEVLLVHVTHFNALMWDSGRTPTRVVEHGVMVPPQARYDGSLARGLVIVNHLARRGRRLGGDVFLQARGAVPLDLVGMGAEEMDGLGEIQHAQLPAFAALHQPGPGSAGSNDGGPAGGGAGYHRSVHRDRERALRLYRYQCRCADRAHAGAAARAGTGARAGRGRTPARAGTLPHYALRARLE